MAICHSKEDCFSYSLNNISISDKKTNHLNWSFNAFISAISLFFTYLVATLCKSQILTSAKSCRISIVAVLSESAHSILAII